MQQRPNIVRVAIFASGAGTNAQRIIDHFRSHPFIKIALIVSNKPDAGVTLIASKERIPCTILVREQFFHTDFYLEELRRAEIDFIVLAGFLWKIPLNLIRSFPERIINIHPALLPRYGGKGMYGARIHEAVINAGDLESGITIHYVDELYDHGRVIFQARCDIERGETPESLASKVHQLEYKWFPQKIEEVIDSKKIVKT